MRTEANLHWSALPTIAPWLYRYWQASTPARLAATARGARPLVERCVVEHEALMIDAGIVGMMRRTGYLRFYPLGRGAGGRDRQGRGSGARPTASTSRWSTAASWRSWSRICGGRTWAAC